MNEKINKFYNWYQEQSALKCSVATILILLPYLYYAPIWMIPLPVQVESIHIYKFAEKIFFFRNLYFIAPYITMLAWLVSFMLYKNIVLKIMMSLILVISLLTQIGMLMGFTSYWNFCIFLPQVALLTLSVWLICNTKEVRQ